MKNYILFLSLLLVLTGCAGANNGDNKHYPESFGAPYEIFVFTQKGVFESQMCDTLRRALNEEVTMVNFPENCFDLFNFSYGAFTGININHRNLILINIDKKYKEPNFFIVNDKYSRPQTIAILEAPDSASMAQLILKETSTIKEEFENYELFRFASRAKSINQKQISEKIDSMFNIRISIPKGYKVRNIVEPNFIWVSNELPETSQGIVIYDYPYNPKELTNETILEQRNKFMANIPSELPNSYMTTAYEFTPEMERYIIDGREWYITKGFWRVENDFMGGPFISYSTIDTKRNRVVVIDTYVYSPNPSKKQRNMIKQLEGIARGVVVN